MKFYGIIFQVAKHLLHQTILTDELRSISLTKSTQLYFTKSSGTAWNNCSFPSRLVLLRPSTPFPIIHHTMVSATTGERNFLLM